MQTREWRTIDKSGWAERGPWDDEPDKAQWVDAVTGLACLAKRHPTSGHWCGYVGVPEGHPWHGKFYDDCDADVHGGLTFSGRCRPGKTDGEGICHVRESGDPEVWWLGFDCAHYWDLTPNCHPRVRGEETYKTLNYVREQCAELARQANQSGGD